MSNHGWLHRGRVVTGALALLVLVGTAPAAVAQQAVQEPSKPWSNEAELAFVTTSGNSSNTTFSISDRFSFDWSFSELVLHAEVFRSESETRRLFNEGGGVREEIISETSAARYELGGEYRQNVLSNMFWYVMGNWYRNEPAGLVSRTSASGGVGYRFAEDAVTLLIGEVGGGLTRETRTGGLSDTFAEGRASLELRRKLSDSADFRASVELFENLQNTADLRLNTRASVTAAINNTFALRLGWTMKYDNEPVTVIVQNVADEPPAAFRFDKTDQTVNASVVVSF